MKNHLSGNHLMKQNLLILKSIILVGEISVNIIFFSLPSKYNEIFLSYPKPKTKK